MERNYQQQRSTTFESERILAQKEHITIEDKFSDVLIGTDHLKGEYKVREVKTRVNQNVFRQIVIANYSGKCAVSGIDIPDLLVASHIIPWSIGNAVPVKMGEWVGEQAMRYFN